MTVIIDKDYYEKLRTIKFKCNISYSNIIKHCIIKSLIRNDEQVLIEDSKMKKATTVLVYLNSEMDEAIRNLR
jgi:predicted CopG family antitoxin